MVMLFIFLICLITAHATGPANWIVFMLWSKWEVSSTGVWTHDLSVALPLNHEVPLRATLSWTTLMVCFFGVFFWSILSRHNTMLEQSLSLTLLTNGYFMLTKWCKIEWNLRPLLLFRIFSFGKESSHQWCSKKRKKVKVCKLFFFFFSHFFVCPNCRKKAPTNERLIRCLRDWR